MINKVILIGNLGGDPDVRYTTTGKQVASFSLATSERWRGQDGQMQEQTEWHRVVAWDKLAEICGQYLTKGSRVYIEGKLQTRKWQDQSGQDRYTTEIVAREMKMLGERREQDRKGGLQNERTSPQQQRIGGGSTQRLSPSQAYMLEAGKYLTGKRNEHQDDSPIPGSPHPALSGSGA